MTNLIYSKMIRRIATTLILVSLGGWLVCIFAQGFTPPLTEKQKADIEMGLDKMFAERMVILFDRYNQICLSDTIKATLYYGEYLIDKGDYKEMATKEQLEERGYKYKYRWVIKTDPIECEYVFLKEPTLKGFTEFLRAKMSNGGAMLRMIKSRLT